MIPWIIQMSTISLILIALIHYLFIFFKTNLTTPKVKDLVNKPQEQYDMLFNTIKNNSTRQTNKDDNGNQSNDGNNINNNADMKNELKNYLKELSNSKANSSNSFLGSMSGPDVAPGPMGKMNIDSGGILTSDNMMSSSNYGSSNYSTF